METRQDFKFVASISKCGYATKQDVINTLGRENRKKYGTESLRFREQTVTVDEIVDLIGDGYAFCATFELNNGELMWKKQEDGKRKCICPVLKDGYMSMTVKRDEFFKGSQIVSIDIDDTQYTNVEDYIAQLTFIPTFAYTSYSDSPTKRKFRLCYVMSKPLNSIEEYKEVANTIHYTVEQDTQEPISDKCGEKASQYFNGTNLNAGAELYKYYVVYDRADFPTIEQEQVDEDLNAKVKCEFDKDTVKAMETQSYQKFMHRNSLKYQYFYQSEIDWKDGEKWRAVDDSFVSLCYRWRGTGEIEKYKDGEHRRRKLKTYACLRRIIKPTVTPTELLFNLYVDRERFFNNSDAAISIKVLKSKVNAAFSMSVEEIKQRYSVVLEKNRRKIVLNMGYLCKLDNIHTIINEAKKEVNYAAIDEFYNSELSVSENLKVLQDNGVSVSRRTIYRYCADRGIKVCYCDSEIIAMLNANDSVRGNLATLKDNGVKIGSKRVAKLLKQLSFNLRVNFEGKVDINECSVSTLQKRTCGTGTSGGESNSQKVTDTLSSYKTTILYKNGTITTPTNQPSDTPTQNDIIDNMQAYLMELENEINNETEEDMELNLKTPSFGDITEEEREFNNDTNEDTKVHSEKERTDDIRGWKFDFGRSNDAMNF
ncbi:hypothetical protein [Prevotella pallens]